MSAPYQVQVALSVHVVVNKERVRKSVLFRVSQTTSFRDIFKKAWWSVKDADIPPTSTPSITAWNSKEKMAERHNICDFDEVLETALIIDPVNTIVFDFSIEEAETADVIEIPTKRLATDILLDRAPRRLSHFVGSTKHHQIANDLIDSLQSKDGILRRGFSNEQGQSQIRILGNAIWYTAGRQECLVRTHEGQTATLPIR